MVDAKRPEDRWRTPLDVVLQVILVVWLLGCTALGLAMLAPQMSFWTPVELTPRQQYQQGVTAIALALVGVGLPALAVLVAFAAKRLALCVTLLILTLALCVPAAMLGRFGVHHVHEYGPRSPVPVYHGCVPLSGGKSCPGG